MIIRRFLEGHNTGVESLATLQRANVITPDRISDFKAAAAREQP
jgi:hypothetical protein